MLPSPRMRTNQTNRLVKLRSLYATHYPKGDEAEVGIVKSGHRPWVGRECVPGIPEAYFQAGAHGEYDHPRKDPASQELERGFHVTRKDVASGMPDSFSKENAPTR